MIRKLLLLLEGCVLLAGLLVAFVVWQQHQALEQPLTLSEERMLDVPAGATPGGVLNRLESEGVLDNAFWLRAYWRFNLQGQPLHSGEYRLTPGLTVRDMLGLWQRGEVVQYSLTLVEGWSFRQVRAALARETRLDLTLTDLTDAQLMERLGQPGVNPEGRFFPDTYRFVRGMSDLDLLKQAYTRLELVLEEEWAQRSEGLPYKTSYDALIMASMIEKETGVPHERGEIAGVFVR
ncbi:MAG TPA: endolytic transglycosylase MltG, partial [Pseudomonas sp.]|nr:endolytic transglycosylase MltG [Pseudomonas sp.]